ncbi:MAG: ATP-dependent Clp protease adapter ClpS [Desulfobulbaceae bacterium]|jgi:ATP-dependent Clp protease adaptor protein ClpS|nr:ATP-dependent Clp protease adapter ClpS [Desulfobulbaceae bacterium]
MSIYENDTEDGVSTEDRIQVTRPPMFKVLLHNDDYTTMEFVIMVLETVFNKQIETASQIMMDVHKNGIGIAGIYTRDIAETKVALVHDLARTNQHPLKCSMEQA